MERVRRVGKLTEDQKGQWDFFKTQWDAAQALAIGTEWGKEFAESIHEVLIRLMQGDANAFSEFVKQETDRVLMGVGALVAPGFPALTDIGQGD